MSIHTVMGLTPQIHESAWIAPGAQIIGDVRIGANTSIWFNCVLRGDAGALIIGDDVNIQDGSVLHGTNGRQGVTLGNRVSIGHNATVHACTVGDDVLIGMGATVLDEAPIENKVFVAAGALVVPRSHLVSGQMYAGSPAKPRRELSDMDKAIIELTWRNYAEHAKIYGESL